MQGTIEQLPKQHLPGSLRLDSGRSASFRGSDVLGITHVGARVSVQKVVNTRQGLMAEGVWVLPPPLGPLEEGNETREEAWVLFSAQGERRLAQFVQGRMLFRPEHQKLHERIRALISSFLVSQGYEAPRIMATDAEYVHLIWNREAKEFQITSRGDLQRHELALAVSAVLEAHCFQEWKHVVAGT